MEKLNGFNIKEEEERKEEKKLEAVSSIFQVISSKTSTKRLLNISFEGHNKNDSVDAFWWAKVQLSFKINFNNSNIVLTTFEVYFAWNYNSSAYVLVTRCILHTLFNLQWKGFSLIRTTSQIWSLCYTIENNEILLVYCNSR